ncbi:PREDICTED: heavy metal-associated isoprenylated plant protein 39-like [Ipomoea nil]|uniref:heavy metal-associated isoprenylated plant protein 39-like n=1 Tax=Ipomoea nil TaxID=35883 RepID=UPI0009017F23|nr:PREDICTED: heavy metal-associated isoprenylated plant protein 39-like [Ipomoea nil]
MVVFLKLEVESDKYKTHNKITLFCSICLHSSVPLKMTHPILWVPTPPPPNAKPRCMTSPIYQERFFIHLFFVSPTTPSSTSQMAQKVVLKVLTMTDDKTKQKAIEAAADIYGVDSIAADLKEQKLTIIGEMDAVAVVKKLKKVAKVDIISVGPAKEEKIEEKKEEEKKEEKKEEDKKEEKKEEHK